MELTKMTETELRARLKVASSELDAAASWGIMQEINARGLRGPCLATGQTPTPPPDLQEKYTNTKRLMALMEELGKELIGFRDTMATKDKEPSDRELDQLSKAVSELKKMNKMFRGEFVI